MKLSQYRLDAIVEEVFSFLLNSRASEFELKLQTLMGNRTAYETEELAMYLRASSTFSADLPTWQILLNASIEQAYLRAEDVSDIFYGMVIPRIDNVQHTMKR